MAGPVLDLYVIQIKGFTISLTDLLFSKYKNMRRFSDVFVNSAILIVL